MYLMILIFTFISLYVCINSELFETNGNFCHSTIIDRLKVADSAVDVRSYIRSAPVHICGAFILKDKAHEKMIY